MKRQLICALVCLTFTASSMATVENNPEWGNDRIIFAAQFNHEQAYLEGLAAGGTILSAEHRCVADIDMYERSYGKGACDKIKLLAPEKHAEESFAHYATWRVVVPIVSIVTLAVFGCGLAGSYKVLKQKTE